MFLWWWFVVFSCSQWLCVSVCAFERDSHLFQSFRTGLSWEGLTLKVATRVPARWGSVFLVPGRAWWCSLHAVHEPRLMCVSKDWVGAGGRSSVAQTIEVLQVAVVGWNSVIAELGPSFRHM